MIDRLFRKSEWNRDYIKSVFKIFAMKSGKVLLGVLAGVAVGAALGVLFAPDKGWNTRKRISRKGEDILDDLREKFDEFLDTFSSKVDEVKPDGAGSPEKRNSNHGDKKKESKTVTV